MFVKDVNDIELKDDFNHFFTKKGKHNLKKCEYSLYSLQLKNIQQSLDMFQDPQWMPQTVDTTKPYIYYVLFLYILTYGKV